MMTSTRSKHAQAGGFLLEALIGVLIFSFGILGIVGLQAASLRHTGDSEYRAEAIYLANSLISKMWTDDPAVLKAKYDSTVGGAGYVTFKNDAASLPGVVVATNDQYPDRADRSRRAGSAVAVGAGSRRAGQRVLDRRPETRPSTTTRRPASSDRILRRAPDHGSDPHSAQAARLQHRSRSWWAWSSA